MNDKLSFGKVFVLGFALFAMFFGAGNLTGIIIGSVLILLLLLLLFFMIDFVWSDLSDRFKLYGTKF